MSLGLVSRQLKNLLPSKSVPSAVAKGRKSTRKLVVQVQSRSYASGSSTKCMHSVILIPPPVLSPIYRTSAVLLCVCGPDLASETFGSSFSLLSLCAPSFGWHVSYISPCPSSSCCFLASLRCLPVLTSRIRVNSSCPPFACVFQGPSITGKTPCFWIWI